MAIDPRSVHFSLAKLRNRRFLAFSLASYLTTSVVECFRIGKRVFEMKKLSEN